ncbi:MAG TPA: DUF58 domain-containing protein [Solirubrobacteraceae bacterium]|nr:DUF58 domain-containing protein [Solirubrobacteraceae bacterium]
MTPSGLAPPPGRQGPGPLPGGALQLLDLALARRAGGPLPGEHRAPGVGSGTELSQLRPYEVGDDVRHLDPSASARTGVPHVRLHVPERALTTWVILDVSPSMAFGTADRLKSDVAEGAVQVVSQLALRRGGRLAMLTAGAPKDRLLPPRGGRRTLARVGKVLEEGVAPDGPVDPAAMAKALWRVRRAASHHGLVVVVSDFRGGEDWQRAMRAVSIRHAAIAISIVDPSEVQLPSAGVVVMSDPETGELVEVDTSSSALRRRYADAERARRDALRSDLRRAGARHVELSTRGEWARALAEELR